MSTQPQQVHSSADCEYCAICMWNTCIQFSTLFYCIGDSHKLLQQNEYLSQKKYLLFSLRLSIRKFPTISIPLLGWMLFGNICNLIQIWCHIHKKQHPTHLPTNLLNQMDSHKRNSQRENIGWVPVMHDDLHMTHGAWEHRSTQNRAVEQKLNSSEMWMLQVKMKFVFVRWLQLKAHVL